MNGWKIHALFWVGLASCLIVVVHNVWTEGPRWTIATGAFSTGFAASSIFWFYIDRYFKRLVDLQIEQTKSVDQELKRELERFERNTKRLKEWSRS